MPLVEISVENFFAYLKSRRKCQKESNASRLVFVVCVGVVRGGCSQRPSLLGVVPLMRFGRLAGLLFLGKKVDE